MENVFACPGLGRLRREAVFVRDYPLLQGIFPVLAFGWPRPLGTAINEKRVLPAREEY